MPTLHPARTLILIWLTWAIILLSFQSIATARFQPQRPDLALDWLKTETLANSQQGKTYLTRWVALPLQILTLTLNAASTLAAVIVSLLGTLAALPALYELSLTSGVAQGMHRYVLAVTSIFPALGRLRKSEAFDRGWCLVSRLLIGKYATLFAFDLWAG